MLENRWKCKWKLTKKYIWSDKCDDFFDKNMKSDDVAAFDGRKFYLVEKIFERQVTDKRE